MVIKSFLTVILIISPLLRASWNLWAQVVIHLITLAALLILLFSKPDGTNQPDREGTHLPVYRSTFLPLFIFLLFCFISIFYSANFYESRNEFFNILNYIIIFYFAKNTGKKYIIIPVLLCGIFLSFYGIYQRIIFNDEHVSSLMHNSNVFAGYLTGLICLTAGFTLNNYLPSGTDSAGTRPGNKKIYVFLLVIFLLALASTGSIASCMAVIFGIFIFFYLSKIHIPKKYIYFAAGIFTVLLTVKILEAEMPNRIIWWLTAGKMILADPLLGVGPGSFADAYHRFKLSGLNSIYAHSYFLQTAAEIGVLGFAALMVFFVRIFNQAGPPKAAMAGRRRAKTRENIPFFMAISAMLFHGIFDYALLIPANAILFWTLLGIVSHKEPGTPVIFKPLSRSKETIFRWISVFLILTAVYAVIKIFLGSRETAIGKYCLDDKKLTEAETHFKKALEYDKYNPQTYFYLSDIYQQYFKTTGHGTYLDEAEIELDKALDLQKYNPQIYFELYNINYIRGNRESALRWLEKTCETSPKSIFYSECYQIFLKEIYHKK